MLITLKTLQKKTFKIEIDVSEKVQALKEKIQDVQGDDYPASFQKLIYSGKILENDLPLENYKITDSSFVVVMVTKPPTKAKSADESKPSNVGTDDPPHNAGESQSEVATAPTVSVTDPTIPVNPLDFNTASSDLVTGAEYDQAIENIVSMGFDIEKVQQAMRASFNNPSRAVDYLMNPPPAAIPTTAVRPSEESDDSLSGMVDDPFSSIRNNRAFIELLCAVRRDPEVLAPMLQSIGQSNPNLLQLISENQQQFLELVNTAGTLSPQQAADEAAVAGEAGAGSGVVEIPVSLPDKEAIERLKALGFSEEEVIQAYFACEKNEQLAANFLLEGD